MRYLLASGAAVENLDFFIEKVNSFNPDYIIAIDKGAEHLMRVNIKGDLLIGDLDSISEGLSDNYADNLLKLQVEKDDTDTAIAVDYALENDATEIMIIPGVGTRFDHSYGNVLLLKRILDKNVRGILVNEYNEIELHNDSFEMTDMKGSTVSFFALDEDICLTLKGFHYPLDGYILNRLDPLAISNKVDKCRAEVIFEGKYLISVIARDNL